MLSKKIKNIIFEYLLDEIHKVEIIYYRDSIWFIDRENRYWYFEYHKVDKHLWWRWSHFTTALTMFSMEAEKEQYLLGELVNIILTKKQNLESKYPNKIFKTVGSVMNFGDKVDEVLNSEVETTLHRRLDRRYQVDEVLNNEVETTDGYGWKPRFVVDEVLNNEIETTEMHLTPRQWKVDDVLNNEVETTSGSDIAISQGLGEVLNNEAKTTDKVGSQFCVEADAVITFEVEKTSHGTLIDEDKIIDEVLSVDIETIGYSKTHRLRPVTGALDYNDNPIEIKSIRKLKGESPLQDVIVSQILDESDKVTDKLKIKEDDYVKTYSHDVYMCDHLVQNVLDVGVNSIHYDAESHTPLIDGILKKA